MRSGWDDEGLRRQYSSTTGRTLSPPKTGREAKDRFRGRQEYGSMTD
jgi:hypothetical protein